jgi:hypothetical protein
LSESPIIHFIRSVILLTLLLSVPGIAICWNHLPQDLFHQRRSESKPIQETEKGPSLAFDSVEPVTNVSAFAPESVHPILPEPNAVIPATGALQEQPAPSTNSENVIQQVAWDKQRSEPNHNFEFLEQRLKELGAKYYRLEKWGDRGELFRFSCFVTPLKPFQYEKYFQAIGADEFSVMESVIADIERWKNPQ